MEWRTLLPLNIYDAKVEAFNNITAPLYDFRTQLIAARDAVLNARMKTEAAFWEPVVNLSGKASNATEEFATTYEKTALNFLAPLTTAVHNARTLRNQFQMERRFLARAIEMCTLNPTCCDNPLECVPLSAEVEASA